MNIRETEAREDMPAPPPDANRDRGYYQICATVLARLVTLTPAFLDRLRECDSDGRVRDFVRMIQAPDFHKGGKA